MAFERAVPSGCWQLPQGGLHRGEDPEAGIWRELREETDLGPAELDLIGVHPAWLAYEIPHELRRDHRIGQVQRWYHFAIVSDDVVPRPDQREFVSWAWSTPEDLIDQVVEFKRDTYRTLLGAGRPVTGRTTA